MSDKTEFELPRNMYVRIKKGEYGMDEIRLYERRWYGISESLWSENLSKFEGDTVRHAAEYMYKCEMRWRERQAARAAEKAAEKSLSKRMRGKYPPKDLDTKIGGDL